SLRTPEGMVVGTVSHLRVTLSPLRLLQGSIAPIRILARHSTIAIRPHHIGGTMGQLPEAAERLADSLQEASTRQGRLDLARLQLVRITRADILFDDSVSGIHLAAPGSAVTLRRASDGAITGRAEALFRSAGGTAPLSIGFKATQHHGMLRARLGPANPARILPGLRMLDLPLTLTASTRLDQGASPVTALEIGIGGGLLHIAQGSVPVAGGDVSLDAEAGKIAITQGWIGLGPASGAKPEEASPRILLSGRATGHIRWRGNLDATVDRVNAAALPAYWPEGLARHARKYVTKNVSGGVAHDARFDFGFSWNAMSGRARLLSLTGGFAADGVRLRWLKGMPEMTGLAGRLRFVSKDLLRVTETGGFAGGFAIHDGHVLIGGLSHKDQVAHVRLNAVGTVRDAVALLRAPRLHAFSLRSGQTLRLLSKAEGRAAAHIDVDVPLKKHVKVKDVALALSGHLADFSLPLPLGSLALRDGVVRLDANIHHLHLAGSAMLADEPSRFSGEVGFDRKAQDFALRLRTILNRRLLAQAGLSTGFWSAGSAPLTVRLGSAPGGTHLALRTDLAGAVLTLPALGWAKQAGAPGTAVLDLVLPRNGPEEIGRIAASAPGFALAARGDGASLDLGVLDVGRSRTSGKITPPARPGAPWMVALAGPVLDLSAALKATQTSSAPGKPVSRPLSWRLRGAFDRVLLRRKPVPGGLTALHVHALGTGDWIGSLHATGLLDGRQPIALAMAPGRGGQAIALRTSDGG
ncbi:MAG TPA: DUF3971 domain-containing protein, partial [Acetobacteraceae bacterium]|nr:DUF3971 domain-containing protein [Acetobacteraceae bacterium]